MRQAITTKYLGPTDHRGSRVVAKCQAGKLIVPWDDALGVDDNHTRAARMFAAKLGWSGAWFGGASADGTGNVYVCTNDVRVTGGEDFRIETISDGAGYQS